MAVNEKDLKALQGMWNNAKPQSDCNLPDGNYEFLIIDAVFKITANGIPQMSMVYEVVGGNETFLGEKVPQRDNLQTPENMGWFKKKLARLGITIPEDVEELMNRIPGELKGKKFVGQLKTKDEFVNVYVNKFLGDVDLGDRAANKNDDTSNAEETPEEEVADLQVGQRVMFTSVKGGDVEGELIEILDGGMSRVKTDEGKIFKVATEKLSAVQETAEEEVSEEVAEEETAEEASEEVAEEAAEEETTEEGGLPTPEEVKTLKLPELKKILAENDMDINSIKNPRVFVTGLVSFIYDEKGYMPDLATLIALRDGLQLKPGKNAKPADIKKDVLKALHERFEF